jgi:hypothetical protein
MRSRDVLLTLAVAASAVLLLIASVLTDLRDPEGTAALGVSLAEDPMVRDTVADVLLDALLADAAGRSTAVDGLLELIRPLLAEAARTAIDSPAGTRALAVALTDGLRQVTFAGPIVIDLRAATLVAADVAPAPLDTVARVAVELGGVGMIVLGDAGDDLLQDPVREAPPTVDELGRVAGLPARALLVGLAVVLLATVGGLIGRDPAARPRRRLLAGGALLTVGVAASVLRRSLPELILERLTSELAGAAHPLAALLPPVTDGLLALLGTSMLIAGALVVLGVALAVSGIPWRRIVASPDDN